MGESQFKAWYYIVSAGIATQRDLILKQKTTRLAGGKRRVVWKKVQLCLCDRAILAHLCAHGCQHILSVGIGFDGVKYVSNLAAAVDDEGDALGIAAAIYIVGFGDRTVDIGYQLKG